MHLERRLRDFCSELLFILAASTVGKETRHGIGGLRRLAGILLNQAQ